MKTRAHKQERKKIAKYFNKFSCGQDIKIFHKVEFWEIYCENFALRLLFNNSLESHKNFASNFNCFFKHKKVLSEDFSPFSI